MTHHDIDIADASGLEEGLGSAPEPQRETYRVVNPLFKRGKLYKRKSKIELDPDTAARFIETGDIEEIDA
jgi:hypothetical protein